MGTRRKTSKCGRKLQQQPESLESGPAEREILPGNRGPTCKLDSGPSVQRRPQAQNHQPAAGRSVAPPIPAAQIFVQLGWGEQTGRVGLIGLSSLQAEATPFILSFIQQAVWSHLLPVKSWAAMEHGGLSCGPSLDKNSSDLHNSAQITYQTVAECLFSC